MRRWIPGALAVVALFSPAAAATAAGEIEVSSDGVTWAGEYHGALFDDVVLAPGSATTATVWLRNASGDAADLSVAAIEIEAGTPLADDLVLEVGVTGGSALSAGAATFAELALTPDLDLADRVEPGGLRRLDVTLRLDADSTNETQSDAVRFTLQVRLDQAVVLVPGTPSPGGGGGLIPTTGVAIGSTLLLAALAVALGSGLRLTLTRHRPA